MRLRLGTVARLKFDKELRRKITVALVTIFGFGTLAFWLWFSARMAEVRDEHQKSWPCASYASYPVRDVPLRCLPGASSGGGPSQSE